MLYMCLNPQVVRTSRGTAAYPFYSYIKLENPTPVSLCAHSLTHCSDGNVDLNNSFPVRPHYPQQLDKRFWERHRRQKQQTPFNLFAGYLVINLQKCFHLPNISPFLAYSVTMYSMSLVSMTCKDKTSQNYIKFIQINIINQIIIICIIITTHFASF